VAAPDKLLPEPKQKHGGGGVGLESKTADEDERRPVGRVGIIGRDTLAAHRRECGQVEPAAGEHEVSLISLRVKAPWLWLPGRPLFKLPEQVSSLLDVVQVHGSMDVASGADEHDLYDDGEVRLETGVAVLSRITPWIADNSGSEQVIVTGIMGVAVNPKCRLILFNQAFQPARECRVQRIVGVARRD
jgi:hypothetical protein